MWEFIYNRSINKKKIGMRSISGAFFLLLITMTISTAEAFRIGPRVFSDRTVTYRFNTPSSSSLASTDYEAALDAAVADWNSTGVVTFVKDFDSPNIVEVGSIPPPLLAVTAPFASNSPPYRTSFDLIISDSQPFYYGSGPVPPNTFDLRTVLRHELGHALGLNHVSTGIMKPGFNPQEVVSIDTDALNGVNYIFGQQTSRVAPASGNAGDEVPPMPSSGSYENTPSGGTPYRVGYVRKGWTTTSGLPRASGGSVAFSNQNAAITYFSFTGTHVTRRYTRAINRGYYRVYIDGNEVDFDDATSIKTQWQIAKTYVVPNGNHIIEVVRITDYIDTDTFIVNPAFPGAGTADDNNTSRIQYIHGGTPWSSSSSFPLAFNGTLRWSNTPEDSVGTSFYGTKVTYVFTKANNRGFASVVIDGDAQPNIDLYSASTQWQSSVTYTLPLGYHSIFIGVRGDKNIASSGTYVDIDRFIIE